MGSRTECLTLNTSECHSGVEESLLSHILQGTADVQQKYYLSQKACEGILRRAERKEKKLPILLRQALESVAQK
jgi:hypothetical protein